MSEESDRRELRVLAREIDDLSKALEELRQRKDTDSERNRHTKSVISRSLAKKIERQKDLQIRLGRE